MNKTIKIDLNTTFQDIKTKEEIKMLSFEMSLIRIIDKCVSRLQAADIPQDENLTREQQLSMAKLPLLTFQNLLIDAKYDCAVVATLKEIFYLAITKFDNNKLVYAFKLMNKLKDDEIELDLLEARALLQAIKKLKSDNTTTDEINIMAKIFGVGLLQEKILEINPNEEFEDDITTK
jgi:hypothetical protein